MRLQSAVFPCRCPGESNYFLLSLSGGESAPVVGGRAEETREGHTSDRMCLNVLSVVIKNLQQCLRGIAT